MSIPHFHSPVSTLRAWRRRIRDRNQVASLTDTMLQDIGISRAEAMYLANRPFWRE
jgi:uncharacterized protein YjiS (DUF1127 family)